MRHFDWIKTAETQIERLTRVYDDEYFRHQRIEKTLQKEFRIPLNLQLEPNWKQSLFRFKGNILPFLFQNTRGPINISQERATKMYNEIAPVLDQIPWLDKDNPIDLISRITEQDLESAKVAVRILQRMPAHLTPKHVVDIVHVIAPHRVAGKRGVLVELQNIARVAEERKKDVGSRLYKLQEEKRLADTRRRRRTRRKKSDKKPAGGFKSRVGAMLKKRPKRKPRKQGKKRKPQKRL